MYNGRFEVVGRVIVEGEIGEETRGNREGRVIERSLLS